jgi:ABC-type ATPase involved in cell division
MISIPQISKDIKEVQNALENLKKGTGTATFILGLTGSGKSSFVSYMLGAKMTFTR